MTMGVKTGSVEETCGAAAPAGTERCSVRRGHAGDHQHWTDDRLVSGWANHHATMRIELGRNGNRSKISVNGERVRAASRCTITIEPRKPPMVEVTVLATDKEGRVDPTAPQRLLRGRLLLPREACVIIDGQFSGVETATEPAINTEADRPASFTVEEPGLPPEIARELVVREISARLPEGYAVRLEGEPYSLVEYVVTSPSGTGCRGYYLIDELTPRFATADDGTHGTLTAEGARAFDEDVRSTLDSLRNATQAA